MHLSHMHALLMFALCIYTVVLYTMHFYSIGTGMWYVRHKYAHYVHISCKHIHNTHVHCIHICYISLNAEGQFKSFNRLTNFLPLPMNFSSGVVKAATK
jgi:hypothetical protein